MARSKYSAARNLIGRDVTGDAQQVECLGNPAAVAELLEDRQRATMAVERAIGLLHVHLPVTEPVQAVRDARGIVQAFGDFDGLLHEYATRA